MHCMVYSISIQFHSSLFAMTILFIFDPLDAVLKLSLLYTTDPRAALLAACVYVTRLL